MTAALNKMLLEDGLKDPSKCGAWSLLAAVILKYGMLGVIVVYLFSVIREKDDALIRQTQTVTEAVANNTIALKHLNDTMATYKGSVDRLVQIHERSTIIR